MAACVPITQEKIRAEVWMGNGIDSVLIAKTPFIDAFNVTKSRNQISTTFSVTVDILAGTSFPPGAKITIKAGLKDNLKSVFTGYIETTTTNPSFGKPSYLKLSLQGRGVLSDLENKKFSRRLKSDGQGLFCVITSGSANRPKNFTSLDRKVISGNRVARSASPNPASATGENSPFVKFSNGTSSQGAGGDINKIASRRSSGDNSGQGTGGGLNVHDHSSLDQGGPAFAVYSAD